MNVMIDESLCTGCGTCVSICPEVFEIQDVFAVNILGENKELPIDHEDACREAAEACPVEAITIEE